jgi:predicted molibdopterin-dependent oxidoreductase YjgC
VRAILRWAAAVTGAHDPTDDTSLERALAGNELDALVMLGHELPLSAEATERLTRLKLLIVVAVHDAGAARAAHVLFPAAAWAEVHGTINNRDGRVQRMRAAYPPSGKSMPAWQALSLLGREMEVALPYDNPRAILAEMTEKIDEFRGAQWGREVRPVQLRFAHSRG